MPIQFKAFEYKEARTNLPSPGQFRLGPNPSYADSLIAGVVSPIIHLPQILWFNSLWPFAKSLWSSFSFLCLSIGAGFAGNANGFITTEVIERDLSEGDKQRALDDMLRGSGYQAISLNPHDTKTPVETSEATAEEHH
jgi:hypothetical protein